MSSELQVRQFDNERGQRRSARPRRMLRAAGITAAVVILAALTTGGVSAAPGTAREQAPAACVAPAPGEPNGKQWPAEPGNQIDPAAGYTAMLDTNCGTVGIALDAAPAPRTVNSFAFLSGEQYFDHTKCHRLTTEGIFVLQCGDPTATGTGGPGYQFPDENLAGAVYPAGTVAMANAGPDTNGSQFFLVFQDSPLPPNYTPFGQVSEGLDVLQSIGAAGAQGGGGDGAPTSDVILNSVVTVQN